MPSTIERRRRRHSFIRHSYINEELRRQFSSPYQKRLLVFANFQSNQESDEDGDIAVETAKPKLKEPPKYAVVLHNDDYTTMEFVIEVLAKFFRKTHEEAVQIMLSVHHEGKGVAGVFSRDIAETKVQQVAEYAKVHGHPLLLTVEDA